MRRRAVVFALLMLALGCGGGAPTRLHTLGKPSGKGEIELQVKNRSSAVVNALFLAESAKVASAPREALTPGTPEQAALWGQDLLKSGLETGGKLRVAVSGPGRWDVRAVDREGREQHVAGLRLTAGGRYVLELEDGGWRAPR
ncbi:MAG: hypothetical protein IT377_21680 [Polyangiaceae bacterium]|nr:hypothetical protein [Polyangiaceae bacterium]